jgi:hypothetical protein
MRRTIPILPLCLLLVSAAAGEDISPKGKQLAGFLDSLDVEKRWLSGRQVKWESGEVLDKEPASGKVHSTHCSAFVAAASKKLGIYVLRPKSADDPAGATGHPETLLANAQHDWMGSAEGRKFGWLAVPSPQEAQRIANRGFLVVASYKESDPKKAGHVAIVRPSTRSEGAIDRDGPEIIQAGSVNTNAGTVRAGFSNHPAAWRIDRQVRFYRNTNEIKLP